MLPYPNDSHRIMLLLQYKPAHSPIVLVKYKGVFC